MYTVGKLFLKVDYHIGSTQTLESLARTAFTITEGELRDRKKSEVIYHPRLEASEGTLDLNIDLTISVAAIMIFLHNYPGIRTGFLALIDDVKRASNGVLRKYRKHLQGRNHKVVRSRTTKRSLDHLFKTSTEYETGEISRSDALEKTIKYFER